MQDLTNSEFNMHNILIYNTDQRKTHPYHIDHLVASKADDGLTTLLQMEVTHIQHSQRCVQTLIHVPRMKCCVKLMLADLTHCRENIRTLFSVFLLILTCTIHHFTDTCTFLHPLRSSISLAWH